MVGHDSKGIDKGKSKGTEKKRVAQHVQPATSGPVSTYALDSYNSVSNIQVHIDRRQLLYARDVPVWVVGPAPFSRGAPVKVVQSASLRGLEEIAVSLGP